MSSVERKEFEIKIRSKGDGFFEDYRKNIDEGYIFMGGDDTKECIDWRGNPTGKGPCPYDIYREMVEIVGRYTCNVGEMILPSIWVNVHGNLKLFQWQYLLYNGIIFFGFADKNNAKLKWFFNAGLTSRELFYLYCHLSKIHTIGKW